MIVVDNGSTDDTVALCEAAKTLLPSLRVIYDERPGLHVGRHAGMNAAHGEVILYGDDDILPSAGWVRAVGDAFSDVDVGVATGPCLAEFEVDPPPWVDDLVVKVSGGWYIGEFSVIDLGEEVRTIAPGLAFGCNFAVRRGLLADVGGFHPDALPTGLMRFRGDGETAVAEAVVDLGRTVLYHPSVSVHHLVSRGRLTLDYIERRAFAEGVSASYRMIRRRQQASLAASITPRVARSALTQMLTRSEALERRERGWLRGFWWHQRQVRSDPSLLEWATRPGYTDESGDLSAIAVRSR